MAGADPRNGARPQEVPTVPRIRERWGVAALGTALVFLLLCCPALAAAPASFQGTAVLPRVGEDAALLALGRCEALGLALTRAARSLEDCTLVRLGVDAPWRRLALAAALFAPDFPPADTLEGTLAVTVSLPPVPRMAEQLRRAFPQEDVLDAYAEVLDGMERLAAAGRQLTARAAALRQRHGAEADAVFRRRLVWLGRRAEALRCCYMALSRWRGLWKSPAVAVRELQYAVSLDAQNGALWCALGEAQLQRDAPQEALASLDRAVALLPEHARSLYARGLAHLRLRQWALAETDLTAALRLRPDRARWRRARGAARLAREDYGPMCEDFYAACVLGDCAGLEAARQRSLCLPAPVTPRTPPGAP